jgi:hypothetical protein
MDALNNHITGIKHGRFVKIDEMEIRFGMYDMGKEDESLGSVNISEVGKLTINKGIDND